VLRELTRRQAHDAAILANDDGGGGADEARAVVKTSAAVVIIKTVMVVPFTAKGPFKAALMCERATSEAPVNFLTGPAQGLNFQVGFVCGLLTGLYEPTSFKI
jgi:hypothetical protein